MTYFRAFPQSITYLPLHNYVLAIAQLRTCHCTITYLPLRNYVLAIAQLRTCHCTITYQRIDRYAQLCYTIIEVITMSELFETAIVEKRNVLNELRSNNMTVQELRFFSIYLSKINPWDKSTRAVRFPIEEFQRIMGFGRLPSLCSSGVGYLVTIMTSGLLK